jgi:hypothetical protein
MRRLIVLAVVLGAQFAVAGDCASLTNPVYLQIGDTQEPVIKALGRALRDSAVNPMTLVYLTNGSCTNVDALYNGTKLTVTMKYVPSTLEDAAWTTASASLTCTPPATQTVDLANAALFVSSCTTAAAPAGVAQFEGPIQAYTLAVPKASTETAITAEEAYFAFGFGMADQLDWWNDETQLFIRPATKSTLLTWAALLGVPAAKWKGQRLAASSDVLSALANSTQPHKALGLLGVEIADPARATVTVLAFQTWHQHAAYFPDSTASAFDKQNVRDGHYVPWSPTVWLTHVDAQGVPVNARVKYVIDALLGSSTISPAPDFKPIDLVIKAGLVPKCAMKVTRTVEGGDLSVYAAPESCGCYFESQVGTTSCDLCDTTRPCTSGTCRAGFCEER